MTKDNIQIDPHHPLALVGLAFSGVLAGAVLGSLTNTINGLVSPIYFINVLGWGSVVDVWRASIAQGIFEGLLFGLFLGVVFAVVVGAISRTRCSYRFGAVSLLVVAISSLACWAIGGLLGMGLASLSPDFYRHTFNGVPREFGEMLAYAWVGGSIWGIEFGGLAMTILGSFLFYGRWQARARQTA